MRQKIGRAFGIDVFIHWTFILAPLYVIFRTRFEGHEWAMAALAVVLLLTMFGCIVLHEFGHALAARFFNVKTIDIIITPLGGLARLTSIPKRPIEEFLITIAGPAVNLAIAAVIAVILLATGNFRPPEDHAGVIGRLDFLHLVMLLNIVLFVFNLLPAFPMDGGRILRSLLAMVFGWKTATVVAGTIGQLFGLLFIGYGIYSQDYVLAFIGAFVGLAARAEVGRSRLTTSPNAPIVIPGVVIQNEQHHGTQGEE